MARLVKIKYRTKKGMIIERMCLEDHNGFRPVFVEENYVDRDNVEIISIENI